jgi:hypothetical protein
MYSLLFNTMEAPTNILTISAQQFADNFNLDVSSLTKQYPAGKTKLDYLPWSACSVLMKKYHPTFVFELELFDGKPVMYLADGSAFVSVIIVDTETGRRSTPSHFPVMSGFGHKAVIDPDSRAISDSIQRAKAKALAEVTGIGLNMWLRVEELEFTTDEPVNGSRETQRSAPPRRSAPAPVVEDEEYEEDDVEYAEEDEEVFETEEAKPLARRTRPAPAAQSRRPAAQSRPAAAQSRKPAPSRGANPFG